MAPGRYELRPTEKALPGALHLGCEADDLC
jgi:hypothetical protein